ncbi:MAG: RNA polymerase sigma-70 factor [Bacteroidetes bacterium]|nr:RNA polymerase sigma-70 factor [Bacteroidota bacterium]
MYDLLYLRLYRFSGYFVKSAELREEIVSDVFLSLWQNRHTLAKIENFEAYVFTVARNRALYYIKKKKADLLDFDHTAIEIVPENSPESLVINSELKTAIENAINDLPERCRLVFLLAKEESLKYREIAEILSISEKTVNAQIVTAIKKLGNSLRKYLTILLSVV